MAAIVPFAGPSLVSAVWFPLNQRTTATAIASIFNYFGFAFSFLLGPLIVTNPEYVSCSVAPTHNQSSESFTTSYFAIDLHDTGESPFNESEIITNADQLSTNVPECSSGEERKVVNIYEIQLESGLRKLLFVYLRLAIFQLLLTLVYFYPDLQNPRATPLLLRNLTINKLVNSWCETIIYGSSLLQGVYH